jgi:hypothetical protein
MGKVQKKSRKNLVVRNPASVTLPLSAGRRNVVQLSRDPGPVDSGLLVPIDKGARQRREERKGMRSGTSGTKTAQPDPRPVARGTATSR